MHRVALLPDSRYLSHTMRPIPLARLLLLATTAAGCSTPDAAPVRAQSAAVTRVTVDSALPTSDRLRRFRATVSDRPDSLRHASPDIDDLVQRWARAIQARDTAALNAMVLDRAEFAWLFYPTNKLALPPYEMPPALMWENILANSDAGARRAIDRLAGRPLVVQRVSCTQPAVQEGVNRVYERCVVTLRAGPETIRDARVFGTIIERNGRFKFLGYANRL